MDTVYYRKSRTIARATVGAALCLAVLVASLASPTALAAFPRTVEDAIGEEIVLEEPPERIFSAALIADNILLSLVEPVRVVGVTTYAADPQYSYVVDRIDDHMVRIEALDPEIVLDVEPDIVLVAEWSDRDAVRQLDDLGLPVYTFPGSGTVEEAMENIQRMGEITGEEETAEQLVSQFYDRYDRIAARIPDGQRPSVLALSEWGTTAGRGTSTHDVIEMAGGRNTAAERDIDGWQNISAEAILDFDPEFIVTASGTEYVDELLNDPVLQGVRAVEEEQVYHVDHMEALNHHFIRGIGALAELFYPDVFADGAFDEEPFEE